MLDAKLTEELAEYQESKSLEELADLLEVMGAVVKARGYTWEMYVLFVTSKNTKESWGALIEVGAAWITQIEHKIFNISGFRPEHPLDDEQQWHTTSRDAEGNLYMSKLSADIFCQKIEYICDKIQKNLFLKNSWFKQ